MIVIDIPANPNCEAMDLRVFHDLEPPRTVSQVRLERHPDRSRWFDVIGWTTHQTTCPALIQKIDDSGEGVALLVRGGDAGLRIRPAGSDEPWQLESPQQWGEPFLILAGPDDIRLRAQQEAMAHDEEP